MRFLKKTKRAFTLIELLVVITIMAVLAGGVLYSTENAREKGKDARRKSDLKAVSTALVSYHVDHGNYPPSDANNHVLDYSSDENLPNWIPDIEPYIKKLPKDPLQATINRFQTIGKLFKSEPKKVDAEVAASQSTKVITSKDDAKRINPPNAVPFQYTVTDNPMGHPFDCTETRNSYMRFTQVQIPPASTISDARITFTPRDDPDSGDNMANAKPPEQIKSKVRGELSLDAAQIPNPNISPQPNPFNDWGNRQQTLATVNYNDIPKWYPYPTNPNDLKSPNLAPIIQEIINQPGWSNSPRAINIFWEDAGSTSCAGRVAVSADGEAQGLGTAPTLDITWTAVMPKPTCSPQNQTVAVGETVNFTAGGGNGISYNWNAPGASLSSGSGQTFSTSYSAPGTYLVDVTSSSQNSDPDCTVTVEDISVPVYEEGACDNKVEIYCYRVSEDKKSFILWAQLENRNDPEIYDSPKDSAICNNNDPAVIHPTNSGLNYCIKSPQ